MIFLILKIMNYAYLEMINLFKNVRTVPGYIRAFG